MSKSGTRYLKLFQDFIADIRIVSKEVVSDDPRGAPLELWESQRRFIRELGEGLDNGIHIFNCLKSRQQGLCLALGTRVLTADLRWVAIEDLKPGTAIVAVDEYGDGGAGHHRRMRTAIVEAAIQVYHEAYKISFEDGRSVVCTAQHPWLTRKPTGTNTAWASITPRKARKANDPTRLKVGYQIRWITKPWENVSDYEDGWFGGIIDGEGTMSTANESGTSVSVHQRDGAVLDRMDKYLSERGYNYLIAWDNREHGPNSKLGRSPVAQLSVARGDEVFRLLGTTRPSRFINRRFWENREMPGKKSGIGWATITSIEPVGPQTLVDLQTSTGTYIAEGFVSHNTTVSLAIDLFWLAMHDNIIGALVTDTDGNKAANRSLLEHYIRSFPEGYFGSNFKLITSNRDQLKFSNGSRLDFLVAGTKKKGVAWAEGRGYTLIHATELAKYGEPEGFKSLLESFAQKNPHRLLVAESTANGYNHWRDRWYAGLQNIETERSFFSGWWAVDTNRIERSDPRFVRFNYAPDGNEREKIAIVKQQYGWAVTIEQLAWIRWKEATAGTEQDLLQQNNPWTADEAFVQSGRSFFHVRLINADMKKMSETNFQHAHDPENNPYAYKGYRYFFGDDFYSFTMEEVPPSSENADLVELKVWEEPLENARYCIGFDPAYGRSEHKDAHCIEVYRCYADKLVQVAEYVANDVDVKHASWVFFHLCAAYDNVMGNVELTGPGRLVMAEFYHLRQLLGAQMNQQRTKDRGWQDAAANARYYLYSKPDSMGKGYVYNFESNWRTKVELMHNMRGAHATREIEVRSRKLLEEMNLVVIDGDTIGAPDSANPNLKDDRVFGTALAVRAWTEWIRREMLAEGSTYERVTQEENNPKPKVARSINSIVYRFLARQEEEANKEPPRGPAWLVDNGLV